jgi:hypothetical protein
MYNNSEKAQISSIVCKHCGWPIHEEPYKEFTVWLDYQGDGIFCGRRNKGLPHEPKENGL